MLLSSILLIIIAAFTDRIYVLTAILIFGLLSLIFYRRKGRLGFNLELKILAFALFTSLFQILFINTGKIFISVGAIHITYDGIYSAGLTCLKILCIMVLSWSIDYKNINLDKINYRYAIIFRTTVKILPEVLPLIKKKLNFGFVLRKVYRVVIRELRENKKNI